jgi:hypothetical protein
MTDIRFLLLLPTGESRVGLAAFGLAGEDLVTLLGVSCFWAFLELADAFDCFDEEGFSVEARGDLEVALVSFFLAAGWGAGGGSSFFLFLANLFSLDGPP